ncbi:flavin reductase [Dietzia lutea]|uniref:flavin reductase n=1 Tax=Dietzia lutea TaxID=546160 RepID=UPI000D55F1C4|nr:flavin reductase [Dietzia lutea]
MTTLPRTPITPPTDAEFRNVIGHFASGVAVVTAEPDGERAGATVSAISSLSLDPPMVVVCLHNRASICAAIKAESSFAVNILSEAQGDLAERFARPASTDKFEGVQISSGPLGLPLITDALAHLECEVEEEAIGGTHTAFLARVITATASEGAPLAYFRGTFGRLSMPEDELAYDVLREQILNARFLRGAELDVAELAGGLDIPPLVLRHALARLSTEGLIARLSTGGYVLPPLNPRLIDDVLDARCAIEFGAVMACGGRPQPDALARLQETSDQITRVSHEEVVDTYLALELEKAFHEEIVRLSGAPSMLLTYRRLTVPGVLARAWGPSYRGRDAKQLDACRHEIVRALDDANSSLACEMIAKHRDILKQASRDELRKLETESIQHPATRDEDAS